MGSRVRLFSRAQRGRRSKDMRNREEDLSIRPQRKILKDKHIAIQTFTELKKMMALRQIEVTPYGLEDLHCVGLAATTHMLCCC